MKKKAKKVTTYYMHTRDGKPGTWDEICSVPYIFFADKLHPVRLVLSLRQIRREQEAAAAWHKEWGYSLPTFGYVRVRLPE